MNILITGGTGLIGTALSQSLHNQGHDVVIVSRSPQQVRASLQSTSWDLTSLTEAIEQADVVVNLAGSSIAGNNPFSMRWTKKRKQAIVQSRLNAGSRITEAIFRAKSIPELLIQASAIGYYGNTGQGSVDEASLPGKDFLADVCLGWEGSTQTVEDLGVQRIIIRIGLVFSPRNGLLELLKLPFRFFLGGKVGAGQQYFSWIHLTDLVSAIEFVIDHSQDQGIYNLTAPNPVQNQAFARVLGQLMKKPSWLPIPAWMLSIVLGEAATLALDGRAVVPSRLLEKGFSFKYNHVEEALADLLD